MPLPRCSGCSELAIAFWLICKRRKLSNAVVAQRAGVSRTTVYKVEAGDPGATPGAYVRVLAVLGLEGDLNLLAADDRIGPKLQDLALEPSSDARRRKVNPAPAQNREESA